MSMLGEKLLDNLEVLFEGVEVKPSVLHGDLWSGNIGGVSGEPIIFGGWMDGEGGQIWYRRGWDVVSPVHQTTLSEPD